jgi:hypothetical protein
LYPAIIVSPRCPATLASTSRPVTCATGQNYNVDNPLVSSTLEAPWDAISVDFIVELPESHGYDSIMNVIDSVTKCVHFIPIHTPSMPKVPLVCSLKRSGNTMGCLG